MDEPPRRRATERKSGSSSRSPSLSRRPSLKDKKVPGTIAKVKGKKSSPGGKKERWLLTRKTWRYMSETVGNLLPESHRSQSGGGGVASGARRASGPAEMGGGPSSSSMPSTSAAALIHSHSTDIPGGALSRPRTMPTAIPASGSGQGSKASSTVTSPTYGGIMSFPSHRPGVTPTGPGPGKLLAQQQPQGPHQILVATEKFFPPSDDIPTLEKHFDAVCSKEKRFLLWTRSKPKGLSGPGLREQKMKKQKEPKPGKSGKQGHRDSSGSILDALRLQLGGGSREMPADYYSPTTEEEDDYDEYDDPEEVTLRERRKSSTASSTMSALGAGRGWTQGSLTFFRSLATHPSHGSESSYSMMLTQQGITICRNTGTQTDPFPEELLIRFRLQAVQEERKQHNYRQLSPDAQSDTTTVENPLSPVRLEQKVGSPPPTTTASSPMSPSTSGGGGGAASGSGRESQEKVLESGSSTRPSISGQSESMATTKSGETATTNTAADKKSEESGYSSSISDTVMRYLRMVRKNSKADNKDTIDKFKTVNYDRSLRYIKSKNVTVEEALEHEKNKQQQAQQKLEQLQQQQQLQNQQQQQPQPQQSSGTTSSGGAPPSLPEQVPGGPAISPPVMTPELESGLVEEMSESYKMDADPAAAVTVVASTSLAGEPLPTSLVATVFPFFTTSECAGAGAMPSSVGVAAAPGPTGDPVLRPDQLARQAFFAAAGMSQDEPDIPPSSPPPQPPPASPTLRDTLDLSSPPLASPPQQQQGQQGSVSEGPSSVGIQAGESLVRFLRNLNPNPLARKMSDFSSSCCSSESPAEVFSPRYSFATTAMSGSASDTEMFSGSVQQAAIASMMAMAQAKTFRRQEAVNVPPTPGSGILPDTDPTCEFEEVVQGMKTSLYQQKSQQQQVGPLSSSWTGSATTSSTCTTEIKKSSSVQQMVAFAGDMGVSPPQPQVPVTTAASSSSYSLSQLFHYPTKTLKSRDAGGGPGGGSSPGATSTPATPTTASSVGGSAGGLMKTFFGSSPFSSTFGLKRGSGGLRKPTSTTSLTITTNTGSDSVSGRGGSVSSAAPPTTSSSPNLLSLIQSSAASAGSGFSNLFSSRSGGGGSGSSVTSTSASRGGSEFQQLRVSSSSATSSSGELRAQQETGGAPFFAPLYSRSSLPISGAAAAGVVGGASPGMSSSSVVGARLHHRHSAGPHHHHAPFSGSSSTSSFMAKGLSDLLFAQGSAGRKGSSAARSNLDLLLTPGGGNPTVMQKSKSSSSVLPLYGSSGSVSGGAGASSSGAAHLRASPSGSLGGGDAATASGGGPAATGEVVAAAAATASNQPASSSSRLISKAKLFKSRSKSSTRATTSSSGSAICTWSPQGRCKWKSVTGKVVTLEPTNVLSLCEVERLTLQDVALEKLRALNLGVDVKIPKEKVGGGQQKPKRRPYLLKKKALSTGFFESGSRREDTKETPGGGSGLVFGISLSQCVANDRLRQMKSGGSDWDTSHHQQQQAHHHKRSQNGSRNSVTSVFEIPKEEKDPLQPAQASSVPAIVTACIGHLENYGLHTTGIFRVSTSLKRIRQLREDIDSGKEIQFGEDHSPHDVAALLKEFLRDLPEPLLCRDLYQAFLKTQKIRNRKLQLEAIQHLVQLLPVSNRDTLASLLKFFSKVVANASETRSKTGELLPGNKMEGYSLATLIAPNILPCMPTEGAAVAVTTSSMDQNAALTKERRESIDLVNYMISNYAAIFEMTPELLHDVYLHLMDTNPEAIEGILRQRCGVSDDGIDEVESSSVFEESEGGELLDPEDALTTTRVYRRREEILHEGAGKDGGSDDARTRERHRGRRDDGGLDVGATSSDVEKQGQSGGESDSSIGTRSTSRWFRRSRGDAKGRTSSDSGSEKVKGSRKRESSLYETKRASSLDSVNVPEPVVVPGVTYAGPSASRVSAVISGVDLTPSRPLSGSDQSLRVPEHLVGTRRQSSPVLESSGIITASLKIPVPVPLNIDDTDIPFIEDENNVEGGGGVPPASHLLLHQHHHLGGYHQQQQSLHQGYLQYPQPTPTSLSTQQHSPNLFQYPHHPQLHVQPQHPDFMTPSSDVAVVRCRSMSTDSSVPLKTTSSSMNTTPISSPARQPSSEVSSPTGFSPPTSPPLYGTFPIEEMTARMLIGSAAASLSTPSTVTALSTSPSLHQFHHGAITMTTPSNSSGIHQYSSVVQESKSADSTPLTRPKGLTSTSSPHLTHKTFSSASGPGAIASLAIPKIGDQGTKSGTPSPQPPPVIPSVSAFSSSSSSAYASQPMGSSTTTSQQPGIPTSALLITSGEPKGLGKETKGANIGGLIKSKTADFDKVAPPRTSIGPIESPEPMSAFAGTGTAASDPVAVVTVATSAAPVVSSSHHQIYSIAPKMRLRSQENVLLKQQFLLRQQQQHQQGESSTRRERGSQKGSGSDQTPTSTSTEQSVPVPVPPPEEPPSQIPSPTNVSSGGSGRPLTRRRLVGSASAGVIGSSKSTSSPRVRTRESEGAAGPVHAPPPNSGSQSPSTTTTTTATTTVAGNSPSRWKRSEIIASRQQSQSSSDPETFV